MTISVYSEISTSIIYRISHKSRPYLPTGEPIRHSPSFYQLGLTRKVIPDLILETILFTSLAKLRFCAQAAIADGLVQAVEGSLGSTNTISRWSRGIVVGPVCLDRDSGS